MPQDLPISSWVGGFCLSTLLKESQQWIRGIRKSLEAFRVTGKNPEYVFSSKLPLRELKGDGLDMRMGVDEVEEPSFSQPTKRPKCD